MVTAGKSAMACVAAFAFTAVSLFAADGPDMPAGSGPTNVTATTPDTVVTATRLSLNPFEQPYAYYRHDRAELDNGVGRTVLDRMDYGPGVIIQRTAPGQSSPYIRGLTGKQSLLLLDGVRLSHAAMRDGPNQYSALIPDMSIDGIDAILGSSSVVNGSDGLTGALDFRLATPGRGTGKIASPWLNTRIDSANGYQAAAGMDGESGGWRYSFEGSRHDFHDRIGGKDSSDNVFGDTTDDDRIPNTAYDQQAVAGRMAYDGFGDRAVEIAFGHTRQNDARRPDGYYENSGVSGRISRYYDPETFSYLHLRDRWAPAGSFIDRLTTTAWWHRQDENQKRVDLTGGIYRRREYDDRVDSIGIEPQATSCVENHEVTYGVFALFERTGNGYREFRNSGGADTAGATPYKPADWPEKTTITDGAEYDTFAAYVQDLWRMTERLSLLPGLRYTYVGWDFGNTTRHTDDITGGLRAGYRLGENQLVFLGASKSFRAPNLSDLDGIGDRASSGKFSEGNPDMDPEIAYTAESGWHYVSDGDLLAFSLFHTEIRDVIRRTYDSAGNEYRDNGESAYLRGGELQWDYGLPVPVGERLALIGCLSYVDSEEKAQQQDGAIMEQPISRANRFYGRAGLRCEIDNNWWSRFQARFHDAYGRDDLASGDETDVRLTVPGNDDGTVSGYAVYDLSAGWVNSEGDCWVTVTLENLADKTYRQLGSGADAPGFNVALAGGVRF